jgi:hypothetical protein
VPDDVGERDDAQRVPMTVDDGHATDLMTNHQLRRISHALL